MRDDESADGTLENSSADSEPQVERQPLAEDYETPASPSREDGRRLPLDHPVTDTNLDSQEVYDEGVTSGSGADAQDGTSSDTEQAQPPL